MASLVWTRGTTVRAVENRAPEPDDVVVLTLMNPRGPCRKPIVIILCSRIVHCLNRPKLNNHDTNADEVQMYAVGQRTGIAIRINVFELFSRLRMLLLEERYYVGLAGLCLWPAQPWLSRPEVARCIPCPLRTCPTQTNSSLGGPTQVGMARGH
jgi:hypothetical protein